LFASLRTGSTAVGPKHAGGDAVAELRAIGLVLNVIDVAIGTPVEIIPGCILRRPTPSELAQIKGGLTKYDSGHRVQHAAEYDRPRTGGEFILLDPTAWRYWVVEEISEGNVIGCGLDNVGIISRLCRVELPCRGLVIYPNLSMSLGFGGRIGSDPFIRFLPPAKPERLDQAVVDQIKEAWDRFAKLDLAYAPIKAAVKMYARLGPMYQGNVLYPLGVFAVIESLLTHDPHGGYDSLTHQIKAKMSLLNGRFSNPIDYSCFSSDKSNTIWRCLYSYRSAIAHGRTPTFDGDLQVLKDEETAVTFLDNAAKTLLRHALQEPKLVLDLQFC
jgi:hypothetical protein